MNTLTVLYIILIGISALLLALFQYNNKASKKRYTFIVLRFVSLFVLGLLLLNPKFEKNVIYNEKPTLIIAADNSKSIKHLNYDGDLQHLIKQFKNHTDLNQKFDIQFYKFGKQLATLDDTLDFKANQTNISNVFTNLKQVYNNTIAPIVLLSDGNQTYGTDYVYTAAENKQNIYPIIIGDTITYTDLNIEKLNVNKYGYLSNKFPVEIIAVYNGDKSIETSLTINDSDGKVVAKKALKFTKNNNSTTINLNLKPARVGLQSYTAKLTPLNSEKNIFNNSKPFAIEIIDQKTNIAIISNINHPDIGALKKAIEGNKQRNVSIIKPSNFKSQKTDFQLVILYQPNQNFKSVFKTIAALNLNKFIITGPNTDWKFLNQNQTNFKLDISNQIEDYQATLNSDFATFIVNDLDFDSFPPLTSEFGDININIPADVLLYKRINTTILNQPLLTVFEKNNNREAILFGEGLWAWRSQSYINKNSFKEFDDFIDKIVQYLASNQKQSRLNITYQGFYSGNSNIIISAQYLNKNYEFDTNANLVLTLKNTETNTTKSIPMVLKQNAYDVDLSGITPAKYAFTITANNNELKKSGQISVLDYNIEEQFLNADVTKLQTIATNSDGEYYFVGNTEKLIPSLLKNERFKPIQKSNKTIVPLISIKILLALIALSLAIEWFLRKYNGLI